MKILDALRGHPTNAAKTDAGKTDGATVPIAGYDRLGQRQVVGKLPGCSQEYERKFQRRGSVLDAVTRTQQARQTAASSPRSSGELR